MKFPYKFINSIELMKMYFVKYAVTKIQKD